MTENTMDKKALLHMRLQTIFLGGLLVIFFVIVIALLVGFGSVKKLVVQYAGVIEEEINALNMDNINDAVVSLTDAANKLGEVDMTALNETVKSLDGVAESLDMDGLNTAVASFTDAVAALEKIDMNTLNDAVSNVSDLASSIDMDSLNSTVSALDDAAANISNLDMSTVNGLADTLDGYADQLNSAVEGIEDFLDTFDLGF